MRRMVLQLWSFLVKHVSCLLITKTLLVWIFWKWEIWYFWAKKFMGILYLLITEKFLFWTFRWWEIRSFLSQGADGKMIFTGYWKVLVLNFSVMRNTVFFLVKKLMERWYLLGLFELSVIFQDLGNMVFRAVYSTNRNVTESYSSLKVFLIWHSFEEECD